ncbi:DNA polymerase III subunit delta' [Azonexus sp. R2A61]|uniref:DNA polymerase III subunit delta' n=1 Tax=Azonexus sp. R2A61 TaxID=2744443 RepID=UPI001F2A567B|nr:DNA polymerase III subunit delta' [Azonexus sp. R2A61]
MNICQLHEPSWKALSARRERLPHALLLIGQRGIGKQALAQQFAGALLCESPTAQGEACGACLACHWYSQGNHPDFRLLQPEALAGNIETEEGKKKPSQQITIDQIRQLDDFLGVGSHRGGLSIVLVNPAETMNRNAANSILKTLEEPPPNTLFILVSGEPTRLLPTIRSRCQVIPVATPAAAPAEAWLAAQGVAEPARWLALAGGAPRLALEIAGSGQGAWLETLTGRLLAGERNDPLAAAGELDKLLKDSKGSLQLRQIVEAIQKWLVDLNLLAQGLSARYFVAMQPKMQALTAIIPPNCLMQLYRDMNRHRLEAEQPLNARLFLEGLFLDYRTLFRR